MDAPSVAAGRHVVESVRVTRATTTPIAAAAAAPFADGLAICHLAATAQVTVTVGTAGCTIVGTDYLNGGSGADGCAQGETVAGCETRGGRADAG